VSWRATYRLQLGPHLDFAGARELVPYLRDLGISHLYLSPSLQARRGSTHGYDVADPRRISDELGGEEEFRRLAEAAPGILLDIVPNHMAASDESPYWREPELRERVFDTEPGGAYRRFFDVDDLAGVRVEDPGVFDLTHRLVLQLVEEGLVDGLRIDHPDGLANPAAYLQRLQDSGVEHVWVEKILQAGEELREWPVEGTTGYEFLNEVAGLFVEPAAEPVLTGLWNELSGDARPFRELAAASKREQARTTFTPEVERLRRLLRLDGLPEALASFPVYRTYIEPWRGLVEAEDREHVRAAALPERLERVLLLEERGHEEFVTRFQQTTGAVMAKGVEDTAFYRYHRFVALNEVGGAPDRFGIPLERFHEANAARAARFPRHLLATQTHDTKRSADVRARLVALSWFAGEWAALVRRWHAANAPLRRGGAPDGNEELLVYQTLLGAWPIEPERLDEYLEKALREAKRTTSWVEQNHEWEGAVKAFARALREHEPFLADFLPFLERLAAAGRHVALGMTLLKLTAPGVPDIYQGDELEFLALVDPDNRRAVDWELRRRLLADLRAGAPVTPETAKLAAIVRGLDLRARRPEAFDRDYTPVDRGAGVIAYRRGPDVAVAVPLRPDVPKPPSPDGFRDLLPELPHGLYERV
jgi:(1->4)-alpha-D-glucan 1-alpha-D-glucosylmutase